MRIANKLKELSIKTDSIFNILSNHIYSHSVKVPEITIALDQQRLEDIIMDLLCMTDKGTWTTMTKSHKITLVFNGRSHRTQKHIYDWLNLPDRKHNFNLLAKKGRPCESENKDET